MSERSKQIHEQEAHTAYQYRRIENDSESRYATVEWVELQSESDVLLQ